MSETTVDEGMRQQAATGCCVVGGGPAGMMLSLLLARSGADAKPYSMPLPLRIVLRVPGIRNLPPRVMAFGVRRARLERPQEVRRA